MAELVWRGDEMAELMALAGDRALARVGQAAVAIMKTTAPVDTGRFKRSLRTAPPGYDEDDTDAATTTDLAATGVEEIVAQVDGHLLDVGSWVAVYPYFLETGTSKMPARPTVQPAVAAVESSDLFDLWANEELGRLVE